MKIILYIFSIFVLIKPVSPVINYFIDYNYISNELCENLDKPQLNCNGKCYLVKELANASENEKPISDKKNQIKEIEHILFFQEIPKIVITVFYQNIIKNTWYNNLYQKLYPTQTFHPPTYFI